MEVNALKKPSYLPSDWDVIRRGVLARARCVCEVCKLYPAKHVHHLTYSTNGKGPDHPDNLLALCVDCHDRLHGKPSMDIQPAEPKKHQQLKLTGISGRKVKVTIEDNAPFMSVSAFCISIHGEHLQSFLEARASTIALDEEAATKKLGHPQVMRFTVDGITLYRMRILRAALTLWWASKVQQSHSAGSAKPDARDRAVVDAYNSIMRWMDDVAEREVMRAIGAAPVPGVEGPTDWQRQILETLARTTAQLAPVVLNVEDRITHVEDVVLKDPDDYITVAEACLELDRVSTTLVLGGQNLAHATGNALKAAGVEPGAEKMHRLDGSAMRTTVKTWPRGKVYERMGKLLGVDFSNRLQTRAVVPRKPPTT